jgi:hypothetical protein
MFNSRLLNKGSVAVSDKDWNKGQAHSCTLGSRLHQCLLGKVIRYVQH